MSKTDLVIMGINKTRNLKKILISAQKKQTTKIILRKARKQSSEGTETEAVTQRSSLTTPFHRFILEKL